MRKGTPWVFLWTGLISSLGNVASAPYEFINLYDSSGPFNSFGIPDFNAGPALNNSGTVAFSASLDTGESGIFTGSGGATTTIVDTSGPSIGFGGYSLNNSGTVAFISTGVFTGNGGPITSIVSIPGSDVFFGGPSLNDSGTVAFSLDSGIFTGNGGPLTTIVDTSDISGPFFNAFSPSINNGGTVAFEASGNGGNGIFTGSGGPITTIADRNSLNDQFNNDLFNIIQFPSLNDSGTVAFAVARAFDAVGTFADSTPVAFAPPPGCEEEPDPDSEEAGILAGSGGPVTTIARCFGLSFSIIPSLNNGGMVAFLADGSIRTGPDPLADRVTGAGDTLFGSTVVGVLMDKESLNDIGQIAFFYELADGRTGIARADPLTIPEPGTPPLLLLVAALLSAAWLRRNGKST